MAEINNYSVAYQPINNTKKDKPKGTFSAVAIGSAAQIGITLPSGHFLKNLQNVNNTTGKEKAKLLNQIADEILISTKLADKGVKINHFDPIASIIEIPDSLREMSDPLFAASRGKNSYFLINDMKDLKTQKVLAKANSIIINKEKMPLTLFHELGHAHNFNTSKIQKFLLKNKISIPLFSSIIGGALMTFNAFTKNSKPVNGELSTKDKLKNTIRNISPVVAGLACLPMLIEEGTASLKAEKWVKDKIPKELFDKIKASNRNGFITYTLATASLILGTYITKKVKDNYNK